MIFFSERFKKVIVTILCVSMLVCDSVPSFSNGNFGIGSTINDVSTEKEGVLERITMEVVEKRSVTFGTNTVEVAPQNDNALTEMLEEPMEENSQNEEALEEMEEEPEEDEIIEEYEEEPEEDKEAIEEYAEEPEEEEEENQEEVNEENQEEVNQEEINEENQEEVNEEEINEASPSDIEDFENDGEIIDEPEEELEEEIAPATDSEVEEVDEEIEEVATDSEAEETDEEIEEVATESEIEEVNTASDSEVDDLLAALADALASPAVAVEEELKNNNMLFGADEPSVFKKGWCGTFDEIGDLAAWQAIEEIEIHDSITSVALTSTSSDGQFEYEVKNGDTLEIRPLKNGLRIEGLCLFDNRSSTDCAYEKLNNVKKIGFYDEEFGTPSNIDLNNASNKNFESMFYQCISLSSISNLKYVMPNGLSNMVNMFSGCTSLEYIDLSGIDTSNVTNMAAMFSRCINLKEVNLLTCNSSNVENVNDMFNNCKELTHLDLSSFNTSHVIAMNGMFSGCEKLSSLDLSSWDTNLVYDMGFMFQGCSMLETIDLSSFSFNSLERCNKMFKDCTNLTTIMVSNNTLWNRYKSGVIIEEGYVDMFAGCTSLVGENGTIYDPTIVVASYACIDGYDKSDNKGYFTRKWDVPTTNYKLKEDWFTQSIDGTITKQNLKGIVFKLGTPDKADYLGSDGRGSYYAKFIIPDSNGLVCVVSKSTDATKDKIAYVYAPYLDDSAYSIYKINAQCESLFEGFSALTDVKNKSYLSTNLSTSFSKMFKDCTNLASISIADMDTSNATDMSEMFMGCASLKTIGLTGIDTSNVTNMNKMFCNCTSVEIIDISGLSFDSLSSCDLMFGTDTYTPMSIKTIIASTNDILRIKYDGLSLITTNMFVGCISIKGGAGTTYDGHTDGTYACIDGGTYGSGYFTSVEQWNNRPSVLATGWQNGFTNVADWTGIKEIEIHDKVTSTALPYQNADATLE